MKKILLAFVILLAVNIGCKKNIVEPVCGCSPVVQPSFHLAFKDKNGNDLLNSTSQNSFSKEKIQLYHQDAAGVVKQIQFQLRPPINTTDIKFQYFNMVSFDLNYWVKNAVGGVYLKLGDQAPQKIKIEYNPTSNFVEKLIIGDIEATKVTAGVEKYPIPVFSFTVE